MRCAFAILRVAAGPSQGARPTFDPTFEYVALVATTAALYPIGRWFFGRAELTMRVRGSLSQF